VGDQLSTASPSGFLAAVGACEQARETGDVCTEATRAGEDTQAQEGVQPAAPANMGSETSGALGRGAAELDLQDDQAAGEKREAREEAKVEENPWVVLGKEGGGSKPAQRRVDLPPIQTEGLTPKIAESGRERKQIHKWEEKTAAGPAEEKLVRADSGWRAERPRRAAVALSPQKITAGTCVSWDFLALSQFPILNQIGTCRLGVRLGDSWCQTAMVV
jgi:hypothetical protein